MPLWWAAENGNESIVKLLLDTGKVNVDVGDFYGLTAYQLSVFNDHEVEHILAARGHWSLPILMVCSHCSSIV
jgi:ankyrin repeat protein